MNIKAPHQPVRSRCVSIIYKRGAVWTREDSVRAVETRREIGRIVENMREKVKPVILKTANVKKVKGGFRAVGFGLLEMSKEEMKSYLKSNGYKRIRMGGLVFAI